MACARARMILPYRTFGQCLRAPFSFREYVCVAVFLTAVALLAGAMGLSAPSAGRWRQLWIQMIQEQHRADDSQGSQAGFTGG